MAEVPYGFVYGRRSGANQPQQSGGSERQESGGTLLAFTASQMQAEIAAFRDAHKKSDVDFGPQSMHHTLGTGPGQAASGSDVADLINRGRVGTTKAVSNSGTFTAETVVLTVVAPLEIGRTYMVTTQFLGDINTAGDEITGRIREDSISGTVMQDYTQAPYGVTRPSMWHMWNEYVALTSSTKTFVTTLARLTGTGTVGMVASATQPAFLVVDCIK